MKFFEYKDRIISLNNLKMVSMLDSMNKSYTKYGIQFTYFGGETTLLNNLTEAEQKELWLKICELLKAEKMSK